MLRLAIKWFGLMLGVCVLLLGPTEVAAQVLDKTILNSTVWISYDIAAPATETKSLQGPSPTRPKSEAPTVAGGTGFLFLEGIGYSRGQVYLVTNKHVLPPEGKPQDIKIRVAMRNNDGSAHVNEVSIPVVGADGKYLESVRVHPDPDTDVAAISIGFTAFRDKFQVLIDAIMTGKYLSTSMLMTSDKMRSADVGMGSRIYIIGFPDALYDSRNVSPVLRAGIIATDPTEGFNFNPALRRTIAFPEHVNGFLVDANVYPGSSGSLVVLGPDCMAKGGNSNNGVWHPAIVGIVAGSIPILDTSLHSYARIGLGIVYSADAIKEVINSFSRPVANPPH